MEDVPKAWNAKMKQYIGCEPPSDAQGCLQDVHWSMGAFGYFGTYTLGAMYACQIFQVRTGGGPLWLTGTHWLPHARLDAARPHGDIVCMRVSR